MASLAQVSAEFEAKAGPAGLTVLSYGMAVRYPWPATAGLT